MHTIHPDDHETIQSHEPVLTNPWLTVGRVFWVIVVIGLAISFVALVASRGSRMLLAEPSVEDGYTALTPYINYQNYVRLILAARYLVVAIFFATGLFIFWRRSNTVIGLVASLEVMLLPLLAGLGGRAPLYSETLNLTLTPFTPLVDGLLYVTWLIVTLLFIALFPSGSLSSRWVRLVLLASVLMLSIVLISVVFGAEWGDSVGWWLLIVASFLGLCTALGSAIYRYFRVSSPVEKQQTRWVMASLVLVALWSVFVAGDSPFRSWDSRSAPFALFQLFGTVIVSSLVPLSIARAITRYQLWDIDVVIRRTLVYTLLTGTLLVIYLTSILVLQRVFTALTGQDSTLATILSTLLIAALFLPLRRRFQDVIDRRFFRSKYDAAKVLEDFAATCRDETDLDKLTAELLRVIQETMQPEHLSLWLRDDSASSVPGSVPPTGIFYRHGTNPPSETG